MPLKIGVLISGSGTNLQSLIDCVENGFINAVISVVITNKENAYGIERAKKHNINAVYLNQDCYDSFDKFNDTINDVLESNQVDIVVLAGYLKILSHNLIEKYKNRIINIHPSLIPSFCGKGYYGIRVHEAAIDYGVKLSGATVHFVDEGADTGPIILQESVKVEYNDTAESLQKKVLKLEHKLLPLAVKLLCEDRLEVVGRKVIIKELN